jgi:hypothetical protein
MTGTMTGTIGSAITTVVPSWLLLRPVRLGLSTLFGRLAHGPNYYGSSFWINDPWQYRLPYRRQCNGRYYNVAVLVDTYTGGRRGLQFLLVESV